MCNRVRLIASCFLAYFIMSGMLAPIGVLSGSMAEVFGLPVTAVTSHFGWLTMGIFVGAVAALFVFEWLAIKTVMVGVYGGIVLALVGLSVAPDLRWVGICLGWVGFGCGMGLPAAALTISRTYAEARRASMLVATDACFSVAGTLMAAMAVGFVARQAQWFSTYLVVAAVALMVVGLALTAQYPEQRATDSADPAPRDWPVSAWLCIGVLATYTLAQNTILWWLPQHAVGALQASVGAGGSLVGQFWSGMLAAQLFVAWWVMRIGVSRLLWIASLATVLMSLPLWWVRDIDSLGWLVMGFGFANLGLLKVVLSYASQFTPIASPRLVSALLLGATAGTAISPWVSSQIVIFGEPRAALMFGSALYLMMLLLLFIAQRQWLRFARATF